ncbi:MAG: ATP-binding cassette domain-containing protein, partial [Pseudomonadota bacterium]
QIAHLHGLKIIIYAGGYDDFERVRQEKLALDEKQRVKQEAQRAHMKAFVDRFRYKASKARQAQSRIKALERMAAIPDTVIEQQIRFAFPEPKLPAPPLITLDEASVGYNGKTVLRGLGIRIDPDDRIALLGANGNGKSTFAKLIAGRLEAMAGEVTRAPKLRVGFFAQHQIEELDLKHNAIANVQSRQRHDREEKVRAYLGRFGLSGELATGPVENLSGGEKTRLALALCCLDSPHILILDEPTNHLDITSTESLASALNAFFGAVILITHDRHLVALTVDRLWLVAAGTVQPFEGDLGDYHNLLLQTSRSSPATRTASKKTAKNSGTQRRQSLAPLRKKVQQLERDLKRLLVEKTGIDRRLADPSTYEQDSSDPADLSRRSNELEKEIRGIESAWLETSEAIESLEGSR